MKTRFNYPTRILFGEGVLGDLPPYLESLAVKRPLLVTDRGLMKTDIPEKVVSLLRSAGLETRIFNAIDPNPTAEQVEQGAAAFREHNADGIVALGGGSPLDAAKAIQLRINHHLPLEEYDDLKGGDTKILGELPPLVAIPTTAGTGSEVSRSAVITIGAVGRKVVIFSPRLMPAVAVCDPELTYGLPARLTAETGLDALSHNLEAYLATGYHPMADGIALRATAMIFENLPRAVANGRDVEARREMLMASTMGAVAFQKGLGVAHSLAHALGAICGISHGLANAILLPTVVEFNAESVPNRVEDLARAAHCQPANDSTLAETIRKIAAGAGLPLKLSQAGVEEKQLAPVVEKALQDGCHQSNPRPCDAAAMEKLLREVW